MRRVYRKWIVIWFLAGWLSSVIFANYLFESGIVSISMLFEAVLDGFQGLKARKIGQIIKTVFSRVGQMTFIWICGQSTKGRCLFPILFLIGVLAGSCLTLMTWQFGAPGLIWFVISLLPHMPFYLISWGLLLLTGYRRGRKLVLVLAVILTGTGIVLEVCAGPCFWEWIPGFAG